MKNTRNFLGKGKLMLPSALLAATLFSCTKEDIQNPSLSASEMNAPSETTVLSETSSANLVRNETFEGSTYFDGATKQFGTSYAFTVASNPVFAGSKAARIELRDTDPLTSGGTRSEVLFPAPTSLDQWYSFAVYFPAADYATDSNNDILNQWHQGESPSLSLRVRNDRFFIKVGNTKETRKDVDLGPQTKDVWHTIVFHVKHSAGSDGLVEVWHNGTKKITYTGGNMYDNGNLPRWKVGIYKDDWNYDGTTDSKKRVIYYDNIKIGKTTATYADMNPGTTSGSTSGGTSDGSTSSTTPSDPISSTTPTEPTAPTAPSTGGMTFTLVDAGTDRDIMTIGNGATINLASLGVSKVNIRANSSTGGSVKMDLSGSASRSYTDNAAPFALWGDDGAGNYYYGSWLNPTGSYTLKATPYSGDNATGTAGASTTISFTFTNSGTTSGGSTTPPPSTSTTPPSTSGMTFTLVDAATEKDVMTISNGATISLSQLGVSKVNIRANASGAASVKMDLSGAMSRSYTDNAAPFALWGDSGSGNYYYGSWLNPTGSYTLKATPYSGSNASGTAGASASVSFTFVP